MTKDLWVVRRKDERGVGLHRAILWRLAVLIINSMSLFTVL